MSVVSTINGTVGQFEEIEDRGRWWIASNPSEWIPGKMSFTREGGGSLQLDGGFLEPELYFNQEVDHVTILGETINHDQVTIIDATYGGARTRGGNKRADIMEESWGFFSMLMGGHLAEPGDALFQRATLVTQVLPEWAVCRMNIQPTDDLHPELIRLDIEVPKSLTAHLDSGEIGFSWIDSRSYGRLKSVVTLTPSFTYQFSGGVTLDDIWDRFITPTLFLTSFVTGAPDRIAALEVVQLVDPKDNEEREIFKDKKAEKYRVISSRWSGPALGENHRWWESPLPFHIFEAHFASVIPSWFSMCHEAGDSLLEFFATVLYPDMFLEDIFARSVRSLEMWHRRVHGGTIMSGQQYKELLSKLKKSCSGKEWELVSMRLRYGNELTQKNRLDGLVEQAGRNARELIGRYRKVDDRVFIRAVIDMRNEMTHGQESDGPPILTDGEMSWAGRTLQFVFQCILLRRLGLAETEIESLTANSSLWRALNSKYNVWTQSWTRPVH